MHAGTATDAAFHKRLFDRSGTAGWFDVAIWVREFEGDLEFDISHPTETCDHPLDWS